MSFASNISNNLGTAVVILNSISVLLGVGMLFSAFFQFKRYGEQRTMMSMQHTIAGPVMMMFAGAILLILPKFIGTMLIAFWGTDTPIAYQTNANPWSDIVAAVLMLVRVVGVGSFIRGIVMISRAGSSQSQPGTTGKALIHIFAGILCVHIMGTIELIENILGLTGS